MPHEIFEQPELARLQIDRLPGTGGNAGQKIKLEITETSLMKDLQNVIPALHRLNEIGVEIAIDDFGTGYSSLAYLQRFPLSKLKIDRSFVENLLTSHNDQAIVSAVVGLARTLGLELVAEVL